MRDFAFARGIVINSTFDPKAMEEAYDKYFKNYKLNALNNQDEIDQIVLLDCKRFARRQLSVFESDSYFRKQLAVTGLLAKAACADFIVFP